MRFPAKITSSYISGVPYLLIELFYAGMPVVRTDGGRMGVRSGDYQISRMGRLPHFLRYGATLARAELRKKLCWREFWSLISISLKYTQIQINESERSSRRQKGKFAFKFGERLCCFCLIWKIIPEQCTTILKVFFFLPKFYIGRVRLKVQPLIFLYHSWQKTKPFWISLSLRGKTKSPDLSIRRVSFWNILLKALLNISHPFFILQPPTLWSRGKKRS